MTYNSYSNYQRMHILSSSSWIDGVPMAISDQFRPPPRIKLPRMPTRHVCDVIEQEYDFSLERRVLADAESRRMAELAEQEADRVATAMEHLADDKPKDPGKTAQKKEEVTWSLGPEIMTPMPMSVAKEVNKGPEMARIRVKDFETVDDPFDDLELKVLDDMAELKSVLDVVQQSTSPTHQSSSPVQQSVSPTLGPSPVLSQSCEEASSELRTAASDLVSRGPGERHSPAPADVTPHRTLTSEVKGEENTSRSASPVVVTNGQAMIERKTSISKRKPVNLDDYNISLPNTDHLMAGSQSLVQNAKPVDLGRFASGNSVTSLPVTNCTPYAPLNGYNPSIPWNGYSANVAANNGYPVISSNSDSRVYQKPVIGQNCATDAAIGGRVNGMNAVIGGAGYGAVNGTGAVIGSSQTFDEYRYAGYKMRSAKSASDLRDLESEKESSYRVSHSPPPRTPSIQNRLPSGGRYSLGGPAPHQPSTNHQSFPCDVTPRSTSQQSVTSLVDPFTSLSVEDQDFVCMFVDMGFPRPRTARAVKIFGKDAKQVTDFLCLCDGLVEQGFPPDHVELAAQLADNQIKPAKEYLKVMRQLCELGFPESDVQKALRLHRTDTERCLDYLTTPT